MGCVRIKSISLQPRNHVAQQNFADRCLRHPSSGRIASPDVYLARSRAFCLPTAWQGLVRINLQGREPNGIVKVGEYKIVCEELEAELLALRHRHNDAPVVKAVVQVRSLYEGPFSSQLPDLSVIWNTGHIVREVVSPNCGLIQRQPEPRAEEAITAELVSSWRMDQESAAADSRDAISTWRRLYPDGSGAASRRVGRCSA